MKAQFTTFALVLVLTVSTAQAKGFEPDPDKWLDVAGTGVHYFTTSIIHSQEATDTGMIQRSTDIVELEGDLNGRILYHPVSVFDFSAGTLVNTGEQVFSGTVLGSAPVMIFDKWFRFDVNLNTGETLGKVYLLDHIAGPGVRCELTVTDAGQTVDGDALVAYTGRCRFRGVQMN
jgi:hypothetical protein